jgi:prepilin peptidase CpaA
MMHMLVTAIVGGLMIGAAISDAVTLRIPNAFPLILVGLFVANAVFIAMPLDVVLWHVVAGVAVLVVSMLLFYLNAIGGGDAKLLAAISLWAGTGLLMPLIMMISLAGLAVALGIYLLRSIGIADRLAKRGILGFAAGRMCPYAVAIAGGWLLLVFGVPALSSFLVIPAFTAG